MKDHKLTTVIIHGFWLAVLWTMAQGAEQDAAMFYGTQTLLSSAHRIQPHGGCLPLATVYSLEPVPDGLTADEAKHILGAQGNLWTGAYSELQASPVHGLSGACGLAKVTWTEKDLKNWPNFRQRLDTHMQRLAAQGVNCRRLDKLIVILLSNNTQRNQ